MGHGFTSRGQESGLAQLCAEYRQGVLPLVLKDKATASPKVKGSLYSCFLITHLPFRCRTSSGVAYRLTTQLRGVSMLFAHFYLRIQKHLITHATTYTLQTCTCIQTSSHPHLTPSHPHSGGSAGRTTVGAQGGAAGRCNGDHGSLCAAGLNLPHQHT